MSSAAHGRSIIRAVIAVLTVGGAALLVPLWHSGPVSTNGSPSLLAVIALFAVAESCVVHVYVNRQAHTFSLSEIPLLLGLAYLNPVALVVGRLAGSFIALAIVRRQSMVKLAFNLSYFFFDAAVAVHVYRTILGSTSPADPRGWVAGLAATTTSLIIGAVAVAIVISAAEGRFARSPFDSIAGMGAVTTALSSVLGLLSVAALAPKGVSPWLLVGAAAMTFAAYRAHAGVRHSANHLEQFYGFSRTISSSLAEGAMDFSLLEETSDVLRAARAELVLNDGNRTSWAVLDNGTVSALNGQPARDAAYRHRSLLGGRSVALLDDTMIAVLRAGNEPLGSLLVTSRIGQVDKFNEEDLHLFEMVASHGSISMLNFRLVEQLRRDAQERHHQALHDGLTGLPNRALLDEELRAALSRRCEAESVVVMLIDLDRFKEVNDTLGHHQGDVLLCKIADRISAVSGPDALVARLGGDEFAVVLTTSDDRQAIKERANAIERSLLDPFELADLRFEVGCSVGIALSPDNGDDPPTLLQRADVAMYAAKRGSTSAEFYRADIDNASPQNLALAADLRRDIARQALLVEYQPKASLPSGDICGVEALARWHHPKLGFIPPEVFVSIAERSGLIGGLTEFVLDVALGQLARWRDEGMYLDMAVNISPRNLVDETLPPMVAAALGRHHVPPSALTLEITESTIIADPARTVATLNHLSDMGVGLAIDDFGTGYSSLSYLHRLPVDEIKIDKSFVLRMTADESDSVIVRSTIDLSHHLGLQVTAEGVEDGQTWQLLAAAGCDQAQGFFLRQSGTGAQMTKWLRQRLDDQRELRGLMTQSPTATHVAS